MAAATIVAARSLVRPMQWCGQRFSAVGERVKTFLFSLCHMYIITTYVKKNHSRKLCVMGVKTEINENFSLIWKNDFQEKEPQIMAGIFAFNTNIN